MTFKEFLALEIGLGGSQTGLVKQQIKLAKPPTKMPSISRMMSAGKVKNPSRPARLISPTKPITTPSVL